MWLLLLFFGGRRCGCSLLSLRGRWSAPFQRGGRISKRRVERPPFFFSPSPSLSLSLSPVVQKMKRASESSFWLGLNSKRIAVTDKNIAFFFETNSHHRKLVVFHYKTRRATANRSPERFAVARLFRNERTSRVLYTAHVFIVCYLFNQGPLKHKVWGPPEVIFLLFYIRTL